MFKTKKLVSSVLAATILTISANATEIVTKISSVKYDYMETGDFGENLDSERAEFGKINGFDIAIRSDAYSSGSGAARLVHELDVSYHKGDTEYVGAYWGGTYGDVTLTTKNKLLEASYTLGGSVPVSNNFALGAQAGLGLRSWERSLADGNVETYRWSNWIAGVRADLKVTDKLILAATVDYQKAVSPKMYSTSMGTSFKLGDTNGYKAGLHAHYRVTDKLSLEGDYIYDYWKIGKSSTERVRLGGIDYDVYEPDSKTKNQYVKMGFAYKF